MSLAIINSSSVGITTIGIFDSGAEIYPSLPLIVTALASLFKTKPKASLHSLTMN